MPELRFGEFEKDGEWKQYILGAIADFSKGKGISKKDIVSNGKLFCIRYGELYTDYNEVIDEVISTTNLPKNELVISKGNEVIIPSSGETQIDIARASCVLREGIALGGDLNIIRSKINGVFLSYYLNSSKKKTIAQMAQGVSVMHLYNSQLKNLRIETPSPKEQQKIANCLTSLDDLIDAENEKLEALKAHKKGLLQQLFPAKEEKVPRVRFREFVGEWEVIPLDEKIEFTSGYAFKSKEISEDSSGRPILRGINITEGYIRHNITIDRYYLGNVDGLEKYVIRTNDLVIGMDGSKVGKNSALISEKDSGALLIQRVALLRAKNISTIQFIFQHINSFLFHSYVDRINTSSGIPHISAKQIKGWEIGFPKDEKEQQKIANCLSSLDDLIAAQSEKIEALKNHKKGLMQQLFPNLKEQA